jgi:hypothetical protein
VPVNGKKWVTLYFARMSEPANTEHADSEDWLYLTKAVPSYLYRSCHLLDRNVCLEVGFSNSSWAICRGSFCVFLLYMLALALGHLKFSLEECIEFTVFCLKTIFLHGLLSFHHFEKFWRRLRQRLQQQQYSKIKQVKLIVIIPTEDKDRCVFECLDFQSCAEITVSASSTLWLATFKWSK